MAASAVASGGSDDEAEAKGATSQVTVGKVSATCDHAQQAPHGTSCEAARKAPNVEIALWGGGGALSAATSPTALAGLAAAGLQRAGPGGPRPQYSGSLASFFEVDDSFSFAGDLQREASPPPALAALLEAMPLELPLAPRLPEALPAAPAASSAGGDGPPPPAPAPAQEVASLKMPLETPREAALRRKREAADQEMERVMEASIYHMTTHTIRQRPGGQQPGSLGPTVSGDAENCARGADALLPLAVLPPGFEVRPLGSPEACAASPHCVAACGACGACSSAEEDETDGDASPSAYLRDGCADAVAADMETPTQAARRRKQEAADREVGRLREAEHVVQFQKPFAPAFAPSFGEVPRSPKAELLAWAGPEECWRPAQEGRRSSGFGAHRAALKAWDGDSTTSSPPSPWPRKSLGGEAPQPMQVRGAFVAGGGAVGFSSIFETPREAARRRKLESATRDLARLKEEQEEVRGSARLIANQVRDQQSRSFSSPFATSDFVDQASVPNELPGDSVLLCVVAGASPRAQYRAA